MSRKKWIIVVIMIVAAIGLTGAYQSIRILKDGAQAYLFGYTLVLMDATRESMTDPDDGRAPVNHFAHGRKFPDHNFRQVVRPNNDTLYSTAWIDLAKQPIILSVPDTAGRYYVMPLMDPWTNVFASVGRRTTGTNAGDFLIAGPDWKGERYLRRSC